GGAGKGGQGRARAGDGGRPYIPGHLHTQEPALVPTILPVRHQPPLPLDRLIRHDAPGEEALEMDVVIVGAGPAGLACAIELARLSPDLNIAVLDKAGSLGEHNLSGAVVNPRSLRELFPDLQGSDSPFRQPVKGEAAYLLTSSRAQRVPMPPT